MLSYKATVTTDIAKKEAMCTQRKYRVDFLEAFTMLLTPDQYITFYVILFKSPLYG